MNNERYNELEEEETSRNNMEFKSTDSGAKRGRSGRQGRTKAADLESNEEVKRITQDDKVQNVRKDFFKEMD